MLIMIKEIVQSDFENIFFLECQHLLGSMDTGNKNICLNHGTSYTIPLYYIRFYISNSTSLPEAF